MMEPRKELTIALVLIFVISICVICFVPSKEKKDISIFIDNVKINKQTCVAITNNTNKPFYISMTDNGGYKIEPKEIIVLEERVLKEKRE